MIGWSKGVVFKINNFPEGCHSRSFFFYRRHRHIYVCPDVLRGQTFITASSNKTFEITFCNVHRLATPVVVAVCWSHLQCAEPNDDARGSLNRKQSVERIRYAIV